MKNNPKVSIIIPVYNSEIYLQETIQSVLNQTYTYYEIIIIDDGSTDNSLQICMQYEKLDDRISVFHTENKGVSHARNVGIQKATGEYLMFLDSDDRIKSETLDICINKVIDFNCDIIMFGMVFEFIDDKDYISEKIKSISNEMIVYRNELPYYFDELFHNNYLTPVWNKLIKTSLIKENDIRFDERISNLEDLCFSLDLIENANLIAAIKFPSYIYVHRKRDSLSVKYKKNMFPSIAIVNERVNKYLNNSGLKENNILKINAFLVYAVSGCVLNEFYGSHTYSAAIKRIKDMLTSDWVLKLLERSGKISTFTTIFRYFALKRKFTLVYLVCKAKKIIVCRSKS